MEPIFFHSYSAMLRNEVGWFDKDENSVDILSMRLANDATFVRAAFSNRLSIFIQDGAAVVVAVSIGMLLGWKLAFVALATLPILTVSAIAQVCIHIIMLYIEISVSVNSDFLLDYILCIVIFRLNNPIISLMYYFIFFTYFFNKKYH